MGSVITGNRSYEVHALPESINKRYADDASRVLLTWRDARDGQASLPNMVLNDGLEIPEKASLLSEGHGELSIRCS